MRSYSCDRHYLLENESAINYATSIYCLVFLSLGSVKNPGIIQLCNSGLIPT